ncbi:MULTISPECIES: alanine--tRNA ligase [Rhodanobacter]|uniref:alanine--tRNA ligase n=1 Tax=Rhodanobacter TaxID=75309 RepID=UPI0004180365|nr:MULTISPECIES: alanine--tRNA ligase [Rhodanobacter]KZC21284.1 alanine--tRNA ligase [Rhodanobacter denitrificans]UJM92613.1 alanine--tRNA ligase [Rhodanobacter denitrificans]UJM96143.1 alanine--tRNA ligase [Rhodanobacter denitrificans]UJN21026.1 alanine--tRNA ligase [Rhodanobacter denitrificans]
MKTSDIRSAFLDYFRSKGHTIVPSSSLVPASDPTLLFTNSGMVQFKNVFLGSEKLSYVRAADVQRCLRAGGKHNDLDAVGYTARHHTFFEMLGNWSFGDYFKRDAIAYAWELLTQVFKLPADKLWVTIYHTDDEAFDIWNKQVGVPAERIVRIGDNKGAPYASDNFWQMADTGPCGPCTEIFYDHGAAIAGGPPGSPDEDGDRYIEIWNLVFMQFDRAPDGTLSPLPAPCVDTGMGLERLAAVLQHKHSNYEIDLFAHLIRVAGELTGTKDLGNKSLRVIADHIRACSFLIVDGVLPSNEGRGYVLRRIIRRALRHGWMLGVRGDFFWKMVQPLVEEMGEAYPELPAKQAFVEDALRTEEHRFGETLEHGMRLFDDIANKSRAAKSGETISGVDAFRLYDTYGFPVDLTADIARERGLEVDMAGFEQAMNEQRARARAAGKFEAKGQMPAELASELKPTIFLGYEALQSEGSKVLGIVRGGKQVDQLGEGEEGLLILDRTPFYAESGGQVGDTGTLSNAAGRFEVADTLKMGGVFFGHAGRWHGGRPLRTGDTVEARVDASRRQAIVLNHSATHLLHAALRKVLGTHVAQKGSLVAPERLRFDFSHHKPMSHDEVARVEAMVNAEVRRNAAAEVHNMGYDQAIEFGAMALFGEKYGDEVRVLKMGDFSTELCGGTHVGRTGDIGLFKIVSEAGVASGVRRIEAVTGAGALAWVVDEERRLAEFAQLLSSSGDEAVEKLRQLFDRQKKLERELESLRSKAAGSATADLAGAAKDVGGIKVVAARLEGLDAKSLRDSVDQLKQQLGDCVVLLAGAAEGRVALIAGVHGRALERVKAGNVVAHVASQIDGKGGGRPDMAQGGGTDTPNLPAILAALPSWVAAQ